MIDEELDVYNNVTRNGSAFVAPDDLKCFFLDPLNDYKPGGLLYIESAVSTVINLIGAPIATVGNAIIILTFVKSDHLRSQSHLFLWFLAFADFFTGLVVQPFYGAYKIAYLAGHVSTTCVFRVIFETVSWFSAALSCTLFASITGERYLALHYHLRYQGVVTIGKIKIYLAYLIITTAILSLLRFAAKTVAPFLYVNIFGLLSCLFTLFFCYWKIYQQVRRHFRQIQDQNLTSAASQTLDVQRFKKSVINMAYVAVLYMISYLPFTCVLFAYLCNGFTSHVEAAYDITRTMAFMPSSWNPFLYFWRMNELREAVKKIMRRDYTTFTESVEL